MIGKLTREPLVLFAGLALCLFAAYALWGEDDASSGRIVISEELADSLTESWSRQSGRPPEDEERAALIRAYVEDEALYRAAMDLGLDREDQVIRQHLAQKMRFMLESLSVPAVPDDQELRRWFDENRALFEESRRCSFDHVYVSADRSANSADVAQSLLSELRADGDGWRDLGDPFLLNRSYADQREQDVTRTFGQRFAARVFALDMAGWQGPVPSPYGVHLVRVTECKESGVPAFENVREDVATIWRQTIQEKAQAERTRALVDSFQVELPNRE